MLSVIRASEKECFGKQKKSFLHSGGKKLSGKGVQPRVAPAEWGRIKGSKCTSDHLRSLNRTNCQWFVTVKRFVVDFRNWVALVKIYLYRGRIRPVLTPWYEENPGAIKAILVKADFKGPIGCYLSLGSWLSLAWCSGSGTALTDPVNVISTKLRVSNSANAREQLLSNDSC